MNTSKNEELRALRTELIRRETECKKLRPPAHGSGKEIPRELRVMYNGIEYYPWCYRLSHDGNGNAKHAFELHDLRANGIVVAELDKIMLLEGEKEIVI